MPLEGWERINLEDVRWHSQVERDNADAARRELVEPEQDEPEAGD